MRVIRVATTNGIDNLKLIADSDDDAIYIKQLASAGTLTFIGTNVSSSIVFSPVAVNSQANDNLISKGSIGKFNFNVRQNQTEQLSLTFIRDGNPIDLTLYQGIKLTIKAEKNLGPILSLDLSSGLSIGGELNNVLNINLSSTNTAVLCRPDYYYDVLFDNGISKKYMVEGNIAVSKTITR